MRERIYYCEDCYTYFRKPIVDGKLKLCPHCKSDWISQYMVNIDSRNFFDNICLDTLDCFDLYDIAQELEYEKDKYAKDEIYTLEDWIDSATAVGGDWFELDMEQVKKDLAKEEVIESN